jgi:hypothetical protein
MFPRRASMPPDGDQLAYAIGRTIAALKPAIRECDLKGWIHHADHGLQWRAGRRQQGQPGQSGGDTPACFLKRRFRRWVWAGPFTRIFTGTTIKL